MKKVIKEKLLNIVDSIKDYFADIIEYECDDNYRIEYDKKSNAYYPMRKNRYLFQYKPAMYLIVKDRCYATHVHSFEEAEIIIQDIIAAEKEKLVCTMGIN